MRKLSLMLLALAAVPSQAQEVERWDLGDPRVAVRFNAGVLRDMGVRMNPAGRPTRDGYVAHEFGAEGRFTARVPNGDFQTVDGGALRLLTGPTFAFKGGSATMVGATLRPGSEPATFVVTAADGSRLFTADHQHHRVDRAAQRLRLFNLDLKVSDGLAQRLGWSALAGQPVGVLEIDLGASGMARNAPPAPFGCVDWGQPDNDVALIGMGTVAQMARDPAVGLVVVAPSATLKNVGVHSVPWYSKFSGSFPPYNNDQHPMLVWNMYRVQNGAIRQIGVSGMKHAFLTLNTNCTCNPGNGNILGPGCEDVYGTGNNNFSGDIGPRSELNAHSGIWNRCGSIFDTNCDGSPNGVGGFNGAGDPRRLVVTDADLGVAGASYFFESWYVVRDDVNIFNTMGYRQVTPTFNGSMWSFGFATGLIAGPVIDAWVNPSNPGANADSQRLRLEGGQLTLAVRATDVGGGRWRYDYALMNHDFDRRIRLFSVPLPPGVTVTNVVFRDSDRDPLTDWMVSVVPGTALTWRVGQNPTRRTVAALDWGRMNSFSFEVDAAPSAVQGVTASLGVAEKPADTVHVSILGPSAP